MGEGLIPAQDIADLILSGSITFPSAPVEKTGSHPFSKQINQSDVKKLPPPWNNIDACTLQLPGTDEVYFAGESRPPFDGESLESYVQNTSAVCIPPNKEKRVYFAPHSIYRVVCEPVFSDMNGLTGFVTNPSSLARATLLVNGTAPCTTTQQRGYNVVPAGFQGRIVAEVRTHEHAFWYKPGDPIAQVRFATNADQSTYTLDRRALQALAHSLWPRGLLNTPDGKGIPFDALNVDDSGKIPIGGDLGRDAKLYVARNSSREGLELYNPKDPHEFFEQLTSKLVGKDDNDEPDTRQLNIPPRSFLLLHTHSRILVPPWLAGSLTTHDTRYTLGAVHRNADFINPSHGWRSVEEGNYGGKITLEYDTESHRTTLRHRRPLINLTYILLTKPSNIGYDGENNAVTALLPGKLFKPWT